MVGYAYIDNLLNFMFENIIYEELIKLDEYLRGRDWGQAAPEKLTKKRKGVIDNDDSFY